MSIPCDQNSTKVKKTVKLKAKHLAKGEKIVKWKVSNPKVAKISKSGKLKALKVGKVKVTATTNKGRKFSCKVKAIKTTQSAVTPPVVTPEPVAPVIVDDTPDDVPDYSGHDIPTGGDSGGGTVYWTPNGSVYHYSRSCSTLSRSRVVYEGTIAESGKPRSCKVCG